MFCSTEQLNPSLCPSARSPAAGICEGSEWYPQPIERTKKRGGVVVRVSTAVLYELAFVLKQGLVRFKGF